MSPKILFRKYPTIMFNVGTIVIVAIMLTVNLALARPERASSNSAFSAGVLAYQGTLMDATNEPLNGLFDITFRIYSAPTGGTPLWEEARTGANGVTVENGLFNVMLGNLVPIPVSVWDSQELFLAVQIGSDSEMSPRENIIAVPYALKAGIASGLTENAITGESIIDGSVTQLDAPSLISSGGGQNEIVKFGQLVSTTGSDANGAIVINYGCFTNDVTTFIAINGHYAANHSIVVGNQIPGKCATTIIVSPPTSDPIRIQWIAFGN